jgi:hypothetical protein
MKKERTQLLEEAFSEGASVVSGFELRPMSIGVLNQCRKMGLSMFVGTSDEEVDDDEKLFQMCACLWLLSQPIPQVLAAVREDRWRAEVELFQFSVELSALPGLVREITRISQQANAATVEVAPKPGGAEKDQPPNS